MPHLSREEREDSIVVEKSGLLRADFCLPSYLRYLQPGFAAKFYVRSWASGVSRKKPFPGFHPGIYLDKHGVGRPERNPFADYIMRDTPEGPWNFEVITDGGREPIPSPQNVRIGLHIHAHDFELLPDILRRIRRNAVRPDLLVSATSKAALGEIEEQIGSLGASDIDVRLVPNRGRNLGSLLTEFGKKVLEDYDIIGHVHTKRSTHNEEWGTRWRLFLLENLLGGKNAMADAIVHRMVGDSGIGLVFPDDPNIVGWDQNRDQVKRLATKLGIGVRFELADNLNFPVGAMFWMRREVLRKVLELRLDWGDYPEEPLPYDGTVLHALERLLPFVTESVGLRNVVTNVESISR